MKQLQLPFTQARKTMGFAGGSSRKAEFMAFCLYPKTYHVVYPDSYIARYNKMATHIKPRKDGKLFLKYGSLVMEDSFVWSYAMLLAVVDRKHQVILYNTAANGFSHTTTRHLGCVMCADYLMPDWAVLPVEGLTGRTVAKDVLKTYLPGLKMADWKEIQSFAAFSKTLDTAQLGGKTSLEVVADYVRHNPEERLAMRGCLELARES